MIKITENSKNRYVFLSLDNATVNVQKGIMSGFKEIGQENKRHLKRLILSPPKTGRFYGKHQASAQGEAPANKTGDLMKSVSYRTHGFSKMEFGESMFYGKQLELGLGVGKRPHVGRTVKEKSKDNYNSLLRNVGRIISK